ncbi:methyltransferase domain-containing protein [Tardiphaga sp. 37S4]|uniref:methyltransferase domain-containing protein n=1 Tax=Tardiphaga sp. 37S4 TaxID=1404741 RepID=UPI001E5A317D|nr:methyltransferase domain-containing protein [Tardiphaga sp. 37S4]UFS73439.1 methyltransferase domain-containing protein [Tardiphaga sp. 37S4]
MDIDRTPQFMRCNRDIQRQRRPMTAGDKMDFKCNVCGHMAKGIPVETIDREVPSCSQCGSSVRFRSIVHLLSLSLFGRSMALPDFPVSPQITGIGLSDWDGYAVPLADKFDYTNTYYHQEPFFDICKPVGDRNASCDFLISTEVFEHVPPPAQIAFQHALDVLKPGGVLILTVPFTNEEQTKEHFPELHNFEIVRFADDYVMVNRSRDGGHTLHENLVFHGGPGTTLEMRVYSRAALQRHLDDAGFVNTQFFEQDVPEWGILHKHPWSLPILARRSGSTATATGGAAAKPPAKATPPTTSPPPSDTPPMHAPKWASAIRDIPTLVLIASTALGIFGLVQSNLLAESLWQRLLVNQTGLLFAVVGLLAIAACFAAARYGRKAETVLALLLLAFTTTICGPAATAVVLLFLLSSWCLGMLTLQRFRTRQDPAEDVITVVTGWSIYAMLFTMVASIPVNMAATHAVVLGLPILLAAAKPTIRGQLRSSLASAFAPPAKPGYGDVVRNAGLVVCVVILSMHLAMVALPDRFFDALLSHLYIPSFMSAHHAWSYDPGNAFSFMPNAADMLYADMFMLQGETAARLLNFAAFFFTCVATFQIISRICSRSVSVWAIALLVSIPLTFIESSTLFVENTVALFLTTAILAMVVASFRILGRDHLAIMMLLAGATMVKLHGAIAAVVIGAISLALCLRGRRTPRSLMPVVAITLATGVVALWPYYYAWLKTGNPVFPFYNQIFKSPFFPPVNFVDGRWIGKFSVTFLYDATFATGNFVEAYNGALGFTLFVFLAAGLVAALAGRNRTALFCGGLGLFFGITFAAQIQYVRYLMIFVPLLMVPVALAIEHIRKVRLMQIPLACLVVVIVGLNFYKMPAGAGVLGISDLAACCDENARRQLEFFQAPERIVNRVINEQAGPAARVLYVSNPFGALLTGTAIYSTWHNSRYAADFSAVKSEQDFAKLIAQIAPSRVVVNTTGVTPLEKAADAYLQTKGRLITRIGWLALYELHARP